MADITLVRDRLLKFPLPQKQRVSTIPKAGIYLSSLRNRQKPRYPCVSGEHSTHYSFCVHSPVSNTCQIIMSKLVQSQGCCFAHPSCQAEGLLPVQHAPIAQSKAQFPLVIFSHGIGGNRTAYSAIICSLVRQVNHSEHPSTASHTCLLHVYICSYMTFGLSRC